MNIIILIYFGRFSVDSFRETGNLMTEPSSSGRADDMTQPSSSGRADDMEQTSSSGREADKEKPDPKAVKFLMVKDGFFANWDKNNQPTRFTEDLPTLGQYIIRGGGYNPTLLDQYLMEKGILTSYKTSKGCTAIMITSVRALCAATVSFVKLHQLSVEYLKYYDVPKMTQEEKDDVVQLLAKRRFRMDEEKYNKQVANPQEDKNASYTTNYKVWKSSKGEHLKKRCSDLDYPTYFLWLGIKFKDSSILLDIESALSADRTLIHVERYVHKRYRTYFVVIPDCWAIAKRGAEMVLTKNEPFVF